MISHFFIDRPIFASAMSIVITLTGAIALWFLPLAQYPRITPPAIVVAISYPGASPQITAETVAAPIEQQVNGIEGMLYMSSQMGTDGSYSLTVTFDVSVDLNTALVMVQNRLALAMPQLPTAVQNQGVTIRKKTPDILMVVSFFSPDGRYDDVYLSNYATIFVKDELLRVDGVSDVGYLGQRDYSIRAWLDPQKLASLKLTPIDVKNAILQQNLDIAAGQLGAPPTVPGQTSQPTIDALGRLDSPEQFGAIVVKVGQSRFAKPNARSLSPSSTVGVPNPLSGGPPPSAGGIPGMTTTAAMIDALVKSSDTSNESSSGGTTASSSTSSTIASMLSTPMTGGARTGGGAGSTGGATTVGAAGTTVTATGGATGSAAANSATGISSSGPTQSALSDLSINTAGGAAPPGATLSSTAMGRGPGRPSASIVRLRDVARVELEAQNYNLASTFDGKQAVGLSVFQLPGTNALDVADRVKAKMEELKTRFPEGLDYAIGYDTTPFIRESVQDVVWTLLEAVVLVAVVVMLFLQSWRAVLIPLIAVPVAIVGTFAVMAAVGFSLNNISLFGLVLAIGIVVDDAIVVVENVERWLGQGLPPREATRKAMDEVTGPIIAVALVLCAVFVPCAFIGGITGRFFVQFAVTIAVSTLFSTFNSLTLSPALAAILLRPHGARRDPVAWVLHVSLGWLFWAFNKVFGAGTAAYTWVVVKMLRLNAVVLIVYAGLAFLAYSVFERAPTGFVPQQDQGRLIVAVQMPDSWSLQLTKEAVRKIERITLETEGVAHTTTISGMSFVQQVNSSNFASMLVILDPFTERQSPHLRDTAIMARLRKRWREEVPDATVLVFGASPIPGLSVAGGFKIVVEDRGGVGLTELEKQTNSLITRMRELPELNSVSTQFRTKTPQLFADIDRTKVASLGVSLDDVNQTLGTYLGSLYVNSFNAFGRHWQVTLQAEGRYRNQPEDVNLFQVRNNQGQMVPLGSLVSLRPIGGPVMMIRYNLATGAPITGNLRPGVSSGEAIAAVNRLAEELPLTMRTEWTELMFVQLRAGNTALYVFLLAIAAVFLALAALYESWTLPLAVILVVPLCLLSSVSGVLLAHKDVDIFVQIGLVVLVGLACKNAILVVEFASQLHREGWSRLDATREASRLRLRPILMTSCAFILGVVPLVLANGAGAEMRRSLGIAVFSGMLGVTAFGVFLTPVFFFVLQGLDESKLLARLAVRWAATCSVGCLVGLAAGFLTARIGGYRLDWALAAGGGSGTVGAVVLLAVHYRLRPAGAPRIIPHAGLPAPAPRPSEAGNGGPNS
jgi:multidrug efflux pump